MKRMTLASMALPMILAMSACSDSDNGSPIAGPPPTPAPAPTPTPPPPPTGFDVSNCLTQAIPGAGTTVAGAVVPDTLTLNLAAASGFPNGRRLTDPVIDVTLAVIFLDLTRHSATSFAALPVNPAANDQTFRMAFPYLAPAQGTPPVAATTGTAFNFRTNPNEAFVRVDRMGMPAVATALIRGPAKTPYNDADPVNDAAGQFVPEITAQLTTLTEALADDLGRLNLTPCARPRT